MIDHGQGESESMTLGRRNLYYRSLDEVMPDVERLLEGYATVGHRIQLIHCAHHLSFAVPR